MGRFTGSRQSDAERAAHTLKGLAGTIGAAGLSRQAGDVEGAIRRAASSEEVERLLDVLQPALHALVTELIRSLPAEKPRQYHCSTGVRASSRRPLKNLDRLLSQDDVASVEMFRSAEAMLSAALGGVRMKSVHLSGVTASRRRCASCVRPPGPELLETLRTTQDPLSHQA